MGELRQACPGCRGRFLVFERDVARHQRRAQELRADARQARLDAIKERAGLSAAGRHRHDGCSPTTHRVAVDALEREVEELSRLALREEEMAARAVLAYRSTGPCCFLCGGTGYVRGNGSAQTGGENVNRGSILTTANGVRLG